MIQKYIRGFSFVRGTLEKTRLQKMEANFAFFDRMRGKLLEECARKINPYMNRYIVHIREKLARRRELEEKKMELLKMLSVDVKLKFGITAKDDIDLNNK